jgi:predicted Rossmann fold nucleotide-binding protein DprA/Smf involved in DNA uptake
MLIEMNQLLPIQHLPEDFSKYLEEFKVGIVPDAEWARELGTYALEYSPLLYRGTLDVLFSLPRVAVVGTRKTRKPSELGVARTRKLMRELSAMNN